MKLAICMVLAAGTFAFAQLGRRSETVSAPGNDIHMNIRQLPLGERGGPVLQVTTVEGGNDSFIGGISLFLPQIGDERQRVADRIVRVATILKRFDEMFPDRERTGPPSFDPKLDGIWIHHLPKSR